MKNITWKITCVDDGWCWR